MPAKKVTAATSGATLWNKEAHKKGILEGLSIDNRHTTEVKVELTDNFVTDASTDGSAGTAQAAEYLGVSGVASGRVRLQVTVPTGEFVNLGKEDCVNVEFLGKAAVIGSVTTTNCVIVARYQLK